MNVFPSSNFPLVMSPFQRSNFHLLPHSLQEGRETEQRRSEHKPEAKKHEEERFPMPMDRKPPIVVSPRRLRSRQLPPNLPKPTAKTATKTLLRHSIACEILFRPDQQLSSEFKFLPDRSTDDFTATADVAGGSCDGDSSPLPPPLFERGRFYEVYSARRNERLKRKMLEVTEETVALYPEVAVELSKRRSLKKWETPRKSLPANFSVSRVSRLQSSEVRSIKKTKKIPALGISAMTPTNSVRKILTRSALRKMT